MANGFAVPVEPSDFEYLVTDFPSATRRPARPQAQSRAVPFSVPYEVGFTNRVDRAVAPAVGSAVVPAGVLPAYYGIDRPPPIAMRSAPAPDLSAGIYLPPPEAMRAEDIGGGIPVAPSEAVTSTDLPAAVPGQFNLGALLERFRGAGGGRIPVAAAAASRRFSSTRPEFIYTNPAAAAQAAQNYQARLNFEAAQDQGYRDYLGRLQASDAAAQSEAARTASIQRESEANRALQREGFATNERIAGASEAARRQEAGRLDWQRRRDAYQQGIQFAEMQNRNPSARVPSGLTYQGTDGRWRPAIADPGPPPVDITTPGGPTAPIESIDSIRSRLPGAQGSTIAVTPLPSQGPRTAAPTDFRVPISPIR